jgi:two-component system LytT family response regulator
MKKIKALIIDDEPPARSVIRRMLAEDSGIEIVGECSNGIEATKSIGEHNPDLLFLDIQMPEMNGFELIQSFDERNFPAVIFITAYDQYAVRAFEVSAVDYLLKPFDHERLETAVAKARQNLEERGFNERNEQVVKLLKKLNTENEFLKRFIIKDNGRVIFVPATDVDWIKSDGNYLLIHTAHKKHIIRDTMKNIETRLDPNKFFRIHRSTIVNIDRIKELQVHFNEKHLVILQNGKELILSRRYRDKLSKKLGASI